jgi:hypothetical protein
MSDKKPISCERDAARCELCGEPMPVGEEMFKFHGYSGSCPKPPLQKTRPKSSWELRAEAAEARVTELEATLARVTAEKDEAQAQIAEAREACPCVRQQRFFDASLLEAVNEEVSRSFRLQSRAEQAEAEAHALREALAQLRIDANRLCDRSLGGTYEDDCRRSIAAADAVLTAGQPREPQP